MVNTKLTSIIKEMTIAYLTNLESSPRIAESIVSLEKYAKKIAVKLKTSPINDNKTIGHLKFLLFCINHLTAGCFFMSSPMNILSFSIQIEHKLFPCGDACYNYYKQIKDECNLYEA